MLMETKKYAGADSEVLNKISANMDTILAIGAIDADIRIYALKFQVEQAADKAAFDSGENTGGKEHMKRALQRMADLSLSIATHVLKRTLSDARTIGKSDSSGTNPQGPPSPTSPNVLHSSSVEDFSAGTEAWLESGAHLSFVAVELLSLILVAHDKLREPLQTYMLEQCIVDYLSEAFGVSREHELNYFQEGYRSGHMRLAANLSFSHAPASTAIVQRDELLKEVLSGTQIDEENPGMVEWAKFTIRNLCTASPEAVERIKQLTPTGISQDSEKLLAGKVACSITDSGKVTMATPPRAQ